MLSSALPSSEFAEHLGRLCESWLRCNRRAELLQVGEERRRRTRIDVRVCVKKEVSLYRTSTFGRDLSFVTKSGKRFGSAAEQRCGLDEDRGVDGGETVVEHVDQQNRVAKL